MNNKYLKWFSGGLLGLMAAFGLGSCSDDHYDLNSTNAKGTLFENLVATHECDSFLMILDKSLVDKKSYGTPVSLSYAELLKGTKSITVWAPKDGTYNAKQWLNILAQAAEADAAGDKMKAAELYKVVEKQFSKNHLSFFNYSGSYPSADRICLANGKYAVYDVINNTIKDVEITDGPNKAIASTNGTIHMLESYIPYAYDLREILQVYPELSHMNDYISDKDTLEFVERLSTPGSVVDGKVQYVDSFFIEKNKIMPTIATSADSIAAAIYFTNETWDNAVEHVKKFYQYKPAYAYVDERNNVYTDSISALFEGGTADSLQNAKAIKAIFDNMYYSLYEQAGFDVENASVASVKSFFENADSLVSTEYYGKKSLYHQHAPQCNELSDGQTPIEASNGYAFIVDNFNFKANLAWQFNETYEMESYILNKQNSKSINQNNADGLKKTVTEGNRNEEVIGEVSGGEYQLFEAASSAANPVMAFNLKNVLSGTYDIYVVMVPENMTDKSNNAPKANKFFANLTYDYDDKGKAISVYSVDGLADPSATEKSATVYTTDPTKVDTILLFKDFKFDVCYKDIPNSRPMLTLTSSLKLADRKTCTPNFNIDCILLVAKDE